jgi:hypothetical protein
MKLFLYYTMYKYLFIFLCLFTLNNLAQDYSFNRYLKNKFLFKSAEELVDSGKYERALKIVASLEPYPDFNRLSYTLRTRIFFETKNIDSAIFYAHKSILTGLGENFVKQYNSETNSIKEKEIYNEILKNFPIWKAEQEKKINTKLKKELDNLAYLDQNARAMIMGAIRSGDKKLKDSLNIIIQHQDSINQRKFDSLYQMYGWFSENKIGIMYNKDLVIIHGSKQYYIKYLKALKKDAEMGNCAWEDLIGIQKFAFFKHPINAFTHDLFPLTINENKVFDRTANEYILYSLAVYLSSGSTYNGKTPKINLYPVSIDGKNKCRVKKDINYIEKTLLKYGAKKTQITSSKNIKYNPDLINSKLEYFIDFID